MKLFISILSLSIIILLNSCAGTSALDKALSNPLAVKKLKISNTNLKTLPPEIAKMKNLKTLEIFRTGFEHCLQKLGNSKIWKP